jgi:hypothetical protein
MRRRKVLKQRVKSRKVESVEFRVVTAKRLPEQKNYVIAQRFACKEL